MYERRRQESIFSNKRKPENNSLTPGCLPAEYYSPDNQHSSNDFDDDDSEDCFVIENNSEVQRNTITQDTMESQAGNSSGECFEETETNKAGDTIQNTEGTEKAPR